MISKIRAKVTEILYLSILCKNIGFNCFVSYSPHVNLVSIRLYAEKGKFLTEPIKTDFYIKGEQRVLELCNRVIYQLKSLLKKNKVNYSKLYEVERIEIDYVF